jgi:pyruvate-formate lyase
MTDVREKATQRKGYGCFNHASVLTPRSENIRSDLLGTIPYISSERVRYYTESNRNTEAEPRIMGRAKALMNILHRRGDSIMRSGMRHRLMSSRGLIQARRAKESLRLQSDPYRI